MVKEMRQLSPVLLFNIKSFLAVSPLHLKISIHILLTVLYTFPMVLTKRICLKKSRASLVGNHFLYSHGLNPLNPKSDQHIISPYSNTGESFIRIMRKQKHDRQLKRF